MSVGVNEDGRDLEIVVVESDGCHFCADAQQVLADFSESYPLRISTVEMTSDTGRALVQRHRPALTPLVLVEGEFFSQGRLPRRKLATLLAQRLGTPASTPARTPGA